MHASRFGGKIDVLGCIQMGYFPLKFSILAIEPDGAWKAEFVLKLTEGALEMGTIRDVAGAGDPISDVHIAGFNTYQEAAEYVNNEYKGGNPIFKVEIRRDGPPHEFQGIPYVVFWHINPEQKSVFLMLSQCHGDLELGVGSCGAQPLLVRDL